MRHQMMQVMRKRLALLGRFARAGSEGQDDVADLALGIGRRGVKGMGQQPGRSVERIAVSVISRREQNIDRLPVGSRIAGGSLVRGRNRGRSNQLDLVLPAAGPSVRIVFLDLDLGPRRRRPTPLGAE